MTARQRPTFTGPNRTGELQLSFLPRLVRRDLHVVRVEPVTSAYRRIVLAGDDLADGFPFVHFAGNDHVKAYFPDPDTGEIVAYRETGYDEWEVDGATPPLRRDYTPRAWDPVSRELTLDFVIHDGGVAAAWACTAQPGDPLVIMGPRANWLFPENYPHYLAAGDMTALPAISRLVEEAPAGAHVTALVEIPDETQRVEISPADGVTLDLRWLPTDSAPVGPGHLSALETAVRQVSLPGELSGLYVFAAGESGAMAPIRRYFSREVGLPKRQRHIDGYWKRGVADHDHHVEEDD